MARPRPRIPGHALTGFIVAITGWLKIAATDSNVVNTRCACHGGARGGPPTTRSQAFTSRSFGKGGNTGDGQPETSGKGRPTTIS